MRRIIAIVLDYLSEWLQPNALSDDEFVAELKEREAVRNEPSRLTRGLGWTAFVVFSVWIFFVSADVLKSLADQLARTAGLPTLASATCVLVGFGLGAIFGQFVSSIPADLFRNSEERRTATMLIEYYSKATGSGSFKEPSGEEASQVSGTGRRNSINEPKWGHVFDLKHATLQRVMDGRK